MAAAPDVEFEEGLAPKKGKGLIIAGALVVLILGGVIAYLLLFNSSDGKAEAEEPEQTAEVGAMVPLKTFVVNLNTAKTNRYLKISLTLEMANEGLVEESAKRIPLIRDQVISYLSGLTVDDVRGADTKDAIRTSLLERVNISFGTKSSVKRVLITEFVVQ